jgi:hypothetical protein
LRARELPQTKEALLTAFDKIFYGEDPLYAINPLNCIHFTQYINPINITAMLAQLFIVEQNIEYGGKSTFDTPSLYIHVRITKIILNIIQMHHYYGIYINKKGHSQISLRMSNIFPDPFACADYLFEN